MGDNIRDTTIKEIRDKIIKENNPEKVQVIQSKKRVKQKKSEK